MVYLVVFAHRILLDIYVHKIAVVKQNKTKKKKFLAIFTSNPTEH